MVMTPKNYLKPKKIQKIILNPKNDPKKGKLRPKQEVPPQKPIFKKTTFKTRSVQRITA